MKKVLFFLSLMLFGSILVAEELTIGDQLIFSTRSDINNIKIENILNIEIHGIITNNNTTILYAVSSGFNQFEICVNKGVSFFYMTKSNHYLFEDNIYRSYNVYKATVIDIKENAIEIKLEDTDKQLLVYEDETIKVFER